MYHLLPGFIAGMATQRVYSGTLKGAVIQCDLKNFSRLSDIAIKDDIEGVEIIAGFLKTVFAPSIKLIQASGGFINVFQGDGFLAVIPESSSCAVDTLGIADSLIQAVTGHLPALRDAVELPDAISIRLSFGLVEWQIFPSEGKYTWYLYGEPVASVNNLFREAAPNVLNCDPAFFAFSKDSLAQPEFVSRGDYLEITGWQKPARKTPAGVSGTLYSSSILDLFYPELTHLEAIHDEYRQIITVFVQIAAQEKAADFIPTISKLALSYGGYLNKLDTQQNYLTVMLVWGAPRAVEKPAHKVGSFALQLRQLWHDQIKIGISTGVEFTGIIGNHIRSEYTAIGVSVNRAARLVHQAKWGEILLGDVVNDMLGTDFTTEQTSPLILQGFSAPQKAFLLKSIDTFGGFPVYKGVFTGRNRELKEAAAFVEEHLVQRQTSVLLVEGLVGIGKSRFVYELISLPVFRKVTGFYMKCDDLDSQSYNPYYHFMIQLLSLQPSDSESVIYLLLLQKLDSYRTRISDQKLLIELDSSLDIMVRLYGMFGDFSGPDQLTGFAGGVDLSGIMARWVIAEAMCNPVILYLDNVQWIDADTIEWVNSVLKHSNCLPVCVISSTRLDYPGQKSENQFPCEISHKLELDVLSGNFSDILLEARIAEYEVPVELFVDKTDLKTRMLNLCAGNPLFAEQLVLYIKSLNGSARKKLKSELSFTELPLNLNYTILSRLDVLPNNVKDVILLATVIGLEFHDSLLSEAYKYFFPRKNLVVDTALKAAEQEHILYLVGNGVYKFTHSMFREIIYSSLTKKRLREYHFHIARLLAGMPELQAGESYYLNIAEHYKKADYLQEASENYLLHSRRIRMLGQKRASLAFLDEVSRLQAILPEMDYNLMCEAIMVRLKSYCDLYDKAGVDKYLPLLEELINKTDHPDLKLSFISVKVHTLSAFGETRQAMEMLKAFLDTQTDQSLGEYIGLYYYMGVFLFRLGDRQEGMRYLNLVSLDSPMLTAEDRFLYHNMMGSYYMFQGDLDAAIECFARAGEEAEIHHLNESTIELFGSLALCYQYMRQYEKSFDYYDQSLHLAEKYENHFAISTNYNNLGLLFMVQNKFPEALYYLNKCETYSAHFNEPLFIQNVLQNIGLLHCELGEFDLAEAALSKQLAMSEELGMKSYLSFGRFIMALSKKRQQHYMEALTLLDSALVLCRETDTLYNEPAMEVVKSEILLAIGAVSDTEPILKHVVETALEHGRDDAWLEAQLLDARRICLTIDDLDEASIANLINLIPKTIDEEGLAFLHFELWNLAKLTGKTHTHLNHDPRWHHQEATRILTELLAQVKKWDYLKRIEILQQGKSMC